jgi:dethiobiotin synthetase/adenosylmethionine--8-amino-7-oxononanoate aminotransferase
MASAKTAACLASRTMKRPSAMRTLSSSFSPSNPFLRHPNNRVHLVFGANTDVGKSVVSAGLVRAAAAAAAADSSSKRATSVNYIKPLQCGGSDESFVLDQRDDGFERVACETLFSWNTPASPHLASHLEGLPVSDAEVLASLRSSLARVEERDGGVMTTTTTTTTAAMGEGSSVTIIESAGGALSPSSSSPLNERSDALGDGRWGWSTQADLYASLELPVVFVGDGKLGGIGVTLASLEALWSRGYRVDAVVFIEGADDSGGDGIRFGRGNAEALREYVMMYRDTSCLDGDSIVCLPPLPPMPVALTDWYGSNREEFLKLHHLLCRRWRDNFVE